MNYVQPVCGFQPAAVLPFLLSNSDSTGCFGMVDCGTVALLACPFLQSCAPVSVALCAAAAQFTSALCLAGSSCIALTVTVQSKTVRPSEHLRMMWITTAATSNDPSRGDGEERRGDCGQSSNPHRPTKPLHLRIWKHSMAFKFWR